jgi:hypothetical protein
LLPRCQPFWKNPKAPVATRTKDGIFEEQQPALERWASGIHKGGIMAKHAIANA